MTVMAVRELKMKLSESDKNSKKKNFEKKNGREENAALAVEPFRGSKESEHDAAGAVEYVE